MNRCVLVTGGSGFVGANLVRRLLRDGDDVHLLLRPGYQRRRLAGIIKDVEIHRADLLDAEGTAAIVASVKPDMIFHLAAYGAYAHQNDAALAMATNLTGTVTLLELCMRRGFEAFVHAGTSSEYGVKDHAPGEDEMTAPGSAYAVSKAAATAHLRDTAAGSGLRVRTVRLYSTYGPWEEPTKLIPTLLAHALRGVWPPLAAPASAHDFLYVDDAVEALLRAAEGGGSPVYNAGTGVQTTLAELVELVGQMVSVQGEPCWGTFESRAWDTGVWVANVQRIEAELGWRARTGLREGLQKTMGWMR